MTGIVKWFATDKGYGFIQGEDNNDYFVHFSNIQGEGFRNLIPQEKVEFEPVISERNGKPEAIKVKRLEVNQKS